MLLIERLLRLTWIIGLRLSIGIRFRGGLLVGCDRIFTNTQYYDHHTDSSTQIRSEKATEFNFVPYPFAVGGAFAAGHLAAVLAHLCRDAGIRLRLQLLTVPTRDLHSTFTLDGLFDREDCPYNSYREMEFTATLPTARIAFFHRHLLGVPRPAPAEDVSYRRALSLDMKDLSD